MKAGNNTPGTNWDELTECCQRAMRAAATAPGRYGGRYVGRFYDKEERRTKFVVLDDDDPDTVPADIDVLAVANAKEILPIGAARFYLQSNGDVVFPDEQ